MTTKLGLAEVVGSPAVAVEVSNAKTKQIIGVSLFMIDCRKLCCWIVSLNRVLLGELCGSERRQDFPCHRRCFVVDVANQFYHVTVLELSLMVLQGIYWLRDLD